MPVFELVVNDNRFNVQVSPPEGNSRSFTIGSIPLKCTVIRSGTPECADVNYAVRVTPPVDIPTQELYTSAEYERVLDDEEMPGHIEFVIEQWMRQNSNPKTI